MKINPNEFLEKKQDHFMTIAEAAETLGISTRTLYRHEKAGRIKFYRLGKRNIVKESDVNKLHEIITTPRPIHNAYTK